ncbi:MAG: hypothetical protein ACRYFL_16940 [Janthinobacterium lividum]
MIWNLLFSLASFWGILLHGFGFFGVGMFIKLLGYSAAVYFQHHFSNEKTYFYLNAGYSIRKMYGYTFLADFCSYLILLIFYFKF